MHAAVADIAEVVFVVDMLDGSGYAGIPLSRFGSIFDTASRYGIQGDEIISSVAVIIGLVEKPMRGVVGPDMRGLSKEQEIVAWAEGSVAPVLDPNRQGAEVVRYIRRVEVGQHPAFVAVEGDIGTGFGLVGQTGGNQVFISDTIDAVLCDADFKAGA